MGHPGARMLETSKSLCVTRHRSAPAAFRTGPGSSSDQQARVSPKAKLTYHMCVVFAFLACVTDPRACACSACWSDFSKVLCNSTPITEPSAHVFGSIPINIFLNRDCTVCITSNSRRFGLKSMRWRLPTHRPAWLQRALVLFLSIGLLITFGTFFRDYVEGALPRHFVTSKSDSGKRHSEKHQLAGHLSSTLRHTQLSRIRDTAPWLQMPIRSRRSMSTPPASGVESHAWWLLGQ